MSIATISTCKNRTGVRKSTDRNQPSKFRTDKAGQCPASRTKARDCSAHPCASALRARPAGVQNRSGRFCRTTGELSPSHCAIKKGPRKDGAPLFMAESEGFEPPDPFGSTVFKTAAFDRSASSPWYSLFGLLQNSASTSRIFHCVVGIVRIVRVKSGRNAGVL